MQRDLHDLRKTYNRDALEESNLPQEPLLLFNTWFTDAKNNALIEEANAMSLSTIGIDGFPKTRIVLLKELLEDGFVFYTNYMSEKGIAIAAHAQVCLHFFWPALERQVTIKAVASKVSRAHAMTYFKNRPRGSQLGAWASEQSSSIDSRAVLDNALASYEKQFEGMDIPLPDFWGGYICKPVSMEFWQGRPNRLHDRILYQLDNNKWNSKRLAP